METLPISRAKLVSRLHAARLLLSSRCEYYPIDPRQVKMTLDVQKEQLSGTGLVSAKLWRRSRPRSSFFFLSFLSSSCASLSPEPSTVLSKNKVRLRRLLGPLYDDGHLSAMHQYGFKRKKG